MTVMAAVCVFAENGIRSAGETAKFISWTSSDGLPSDTVLDICEDSDGFLWLATGNGLCRFNGVSFRTYAPESGKQEPATCVSFGNDGFIYAGASSGLVRLDRVSGRIERLPVTEGTGVKAIMPDSGEVLWMHLSDGTVRRYSTSTGETESADFKGAFPEGDYYYDHIFKDGGGTIWVGGRALSVARIDGGDLRTFTYPVRNPDIEHFEGSAFVSDSDGVLHASDDKGNFSVYDREAGIFRTVLKIPSGTTCAAADSAGRIWIGGRSGLIRLLPDKSGYERFPCSGRAGDVISNNIYCLYTDRAGNLWAGTDKGLSLFRRSGRAVASFSKENGLSSNAVTALMQDRDSLLWIGTEEDGTDTLNLRTLSSGNLRYSLLSGRLPERTRIRERETLRQYALHGLKRDSGLDENKVSALYQDSEGTIYIGLWSHIGFNTYDKKSGTFKRHCLWSVPAGYVFPLLFEGNLFGANWYTGFLEDNDGNLWCTTWEGVGLNLFDRKKGEFTGRHFIPGDVPRMPRGTISTHADDTGDGKIYMAGGKWYGYFDLRTRDFHRYVENFPEDFPNADIIRRYYAYSPAKQIDIPVNTLDLRVLDKYGDHVLVASANSLFAHNTATDEVVVLHRPRKFRIEYETFTCGEDIFVLWDDECVKVVRDGDSGYRCLPAHAPAQEMRVYPSDGGTFSLGGDSLFVQTENGSTIRTGGRTIDISRNAQGTLPSRLASCIAQDREGLLWYGTTDSGLCRIDVSSGEITSFRHDPSVPDGLPGNDIRDIFIDSSGTVWAGTDKGLCRLDRTGNFSTDERTSGLSVRRILEDRDGRLWISTDSGLSYLFPSGSASFHRYDGLSNEAYSSAAAVLHDGRLAFGGNGGLDIIDPRELLSMKAPAVLTADLRTADGILFHCIPEKLRLRRKENSFSVDFSVCGYPGHSKRYRLEGFETGWNYDGDDIATARYTNVPGGRYTLRMEVLDSFGDWTGKSVLIDVDYPVWLRWWFILLAGTLTVIAAVLVVRIRERMLRRENEKLARQVEARTEEIRRQIDSKNKFFSIVSHDLKNPVNSLALLSGSLLSNWDRLSEEDKLKRIKIIGTSASGTSAMLEDILMWALTESGVMVPDMERLNAHDAVEDAIQSLKAVSARKDVTIVNSVGRDKEVCADRNMLSVIFRNLLSNAIKYSYKGGTVTVSASPAGGKVVLAVEDAGTGMDADTAGKLFRTDCKISVKGTDGESGSGFGLITVREFLGRMGESIRVESCPGKGSRFIFTLAPADGGNNNFSAKNSGSF